jgi:zinc transporter ZupT
MLKLSLILGTVAALADVAGGLVLVKAEGIQKYLRYFVALGAGFLMATSVLEMLPESLKLDPTMAPILVMFGYCALHFLEHTIVAHFHFGKETHHHEFVSAHTSYSVMGGLAVHALFDGVAIGSGFAINSILGWLIFLAIFLHKAPDCPASPAAGDLSKSRLCCTSRGDHRMRRSCFLPASILVL